MSVLLFVDSFKHYSTAQMNRKWTLPGGRIEDDALKLFSGQSLFKTFGASSIFTAGVRHSTFTFAGQPLAFYDVPNDRRVYLEHVGDGRLRVSMAGFIPDGNAWTVEVRVNGNVTPIISGTITRNSVETITSTYTLQSGTEYYLEFQAQRISGGQDFYSLLILGPGGGLDATYRDLYVTDDEFLGDCEVRLLVPDADGDDGDFTPSSGTDDFAMVDEVPADDETTTLSSDTVGDKVLVHVENLPAGVAAILGVQVLNLTTKSEAGSVAHQSRARVSASDIDFPDTFYPSLGSWRYDIMPLRVNPLTAVDFTASEVNGLQQGLENVTP